MVSAVTVISEDPIVISVTVIDQSEAITVRSGITARAGGGQANATLLNKNYNIVETVATASDSCKLDTATVSKIREVYNTSANEMELFPATGERFKEGNNLLAINEAIIIGPMNRIKFVCYENGQWFY